MKNTIITIASLAMFTAANAQTFEIWDLTGNGTGSSGVLANGSTITTVDSSASVMWTSTDPSFLSTYASNPFTGIFVVAGDSVDITIGAPTQPGTSMHLVVLDLDNGEETTLSGNTFSAPIAHFASANGGTAGQPSVWDAGTQTLTGLSAPSGANPSRAVDVFDITGFTNFTISNTGIGSGGAWAIYTTVPEPSSALLLGLGGLGLVARRKR